MLPSSFINVNPVCTSVIVSLFNERFSFHSLFLFLPLFFFFLYLFIYFFFFLSLFYFFFYRHHRSSRPWDFLLIFDLWKLDNDTTITPLDILSNLYWIIANKKRRKRLKIPILLPQKLIRYFSKFSPLFLSPRLVSLNVTLKKKMGYRKEAIGKIYFRCELKRLNWIKLKIRIKRKKKQIYKNKGERKRVRKETKKEKGTKKKKGKRRTDR